MKKEETEKDSKDIEEEKDSEEESELEEKIEITEDKIDTRQFQNFLKNDFPEMPEEMQTQESKAPVLESINSPQRNTFFRLETSLDEKDFDEEDKINYKLMDSKKDEKEYHTMSQEYKTLQQEILKHNPNIISKEQSFLDLNQKNIVENLPKQNINPFIEKDLKNEDKNYIVKHSFEEKERKPHNPFEKQELKYEP